MKPKTLLPSVKQTKLLWIIMGMCVVLTLPWLGRKPFHTKGEPREAITAQAMVASGNWILPERYGEDEATKPPLAHWMISLFSMPGGEITEGSSRLPSALSYIVLGALMFGFLAKRVAPLKAFTAAFILITSFLYFRGALTARVDMLLTVFMVAGLLRMFRWEEKTRREEQPGGKKGLFRGIPWDISLLLGLASLTKGPVGMILPCFVFAVYLLVLRYPIRTVFIALLKIAPLAAILPALWYFAAWLQGGDKFLAVVLDENFARFTGKMTIGGTHEHSVFYMLASVCWGFLPWTLIPLMALVTLKIKKRTNRMFQTLWNKMCTQWNRLPELPGYKLFSIIAAVCILLFYAIPASKRDVYLLPAYPFICVFLADLFWYIAEKKAVVWKIFGWMLSVMTALLLILLFAITSHLITAQNLAGLGIKSDSLTFYLDHLSLLYKDAPWLDYPLTLLCWAGCIYLLAGLLSSDRKQKETNIMFRTGVCLFGLFLLLNSTIQPKVGQALSPQPFAQEIMKQQIPPNQIYFYKLGFYGLSFYLNNRFEKLESHLPAFGYVLVGQKEYADFESWAQNKYLCRVQASTPNQYNDMRQQILLIRFDRKLQ